MKVKDGFKFGVGFLIAYDLYWFLYNRTRAFFENLEHQTDQDPNMNTTDVGADSATD